MRVMTIFRWITGKRNKDDRTCASSGTRRGAAPLRLVVVQMNMNRHRHHAATLSTSAILAVFIIGCASPHRGGHATNSDSWDVYDQAQHAAALVALRYAAILQHLNEGHPDKALESTDLWLDQTIYTLAELEREHPKRDWANSPVSGDGALPMRRVYKEIATVRHQYPRSHNVPYKPEELDLINDFVDRYK